MNIADNPILTDNQKNLLTRFGVSPLRDSFYLTGDGFGETGDHGVSQSARSGTACIISPKLAQVSPS